MSRDGQKALSKINADFQRGLIDAEQWISLNSQIETKYGIKSVATTKGEVQGRVFGTSRHWRYPPVYQYMAYNEDLRAWSLQNKSTWKDVTAERLHVRIAARNPHENMAGMYIWLRTFDYKDKVVQTICELRAAKQLVDNKIKTVFFHFAAGKVFHSKDESAFRHEFKDFLDMKALSIEDSAYDAVFAEVDYIAQNHSYKIDEHQKARFLAQLSTKKARVCPGGEVNPPVEN